MLVRTPDFADGDFEPFNPDAIQDKAKEAEKTEGETPAKAETPAPTPAAPAAKRGKPADKPEEPEVPKPVEAPAESSATKPKDPGGIARSGEVPSSGDAASELVFFLSPLNEHLAKGERLRLNILASGGKGITEGSLDLVVDPKLSMTGLGPGEFITTEGGSIEQVPGKAGAVTIRFRRNGGATDSGSLVWIEVEAKQSGNAPVVIQGGRFSVGSNPVSGRWVNALVTVD